MIDDRVLIELKSVEKLADIHFKQVRTYLKLTDLKPGLLINFNSALIKDGMHRVVNNLQFDLPENNLPANLTPNPATQNL